MNLNCRFIIMNKKYIFYNSIIVAVLFSFCIYSQDCDGGYTYIENLPEENFSNIINENNCFNDNNIAVLNELISLNNLDNYNSCLELGPQTWVAGDITSLVVTYIQGGNNGITQKISEIPENIDQLTALSYLAIEKHDIITIPSNFTQLSSLTSLKISNNWLTSLPENFGNLTSLIILDFGYNQLASIPESIGGLINLEYLFLFNNQLTFLPETICNLNLDWDGISPANYPYFASGGNYLCDCDLIPDCVESSANINISMEQNYYSFLLDAPQDCSSLQNCCELNIHPQLSDSLGDLNADGGWNVLDIVTLANCVLTDNCAGLENGCAGDLNGDGGYNVLDIVTLANCVLADNCGG